VEKIKALWTDEDGVTTVEYALLLAVLVVGAVSIWTALKGGIQSGVNAASAEIDSPL
jgi:Flp pilus assembly pilin Flp